ncbi:15599_t:CDS:2 [Funneliformis caledonium]|uniref:15599_t:CDS:1 n=1 Tax=Funneliformis caledonium TaxID=1117310 RepID=A0A9N9HQH0_9GLOM|nr:15599_t:CDS:2 [Funneliformis caledonium]
MFCDAAPFIEPINNNNDEEEYVFRDVLGSKFEGYNEKGYLSVIWEEDMLKNIQD